MRRGTRGRRGGRAQCAAFVCISRQIKKGFRGFSLGREVFWVLWEILELAGGMDRYTSGAADGLSEHGWRSSGLVSILGSISVFKSLF